MDDKASKLQNLLQHTDTETVPDSELTEQAMSVSVAVLQSIITTYHLAQKWRRFSDE